MNELIVFLLFRGWTVAVGFVERPQGWVWELFSIRGEHTMFVRAHSQLDALRAAAAMAIRIDAEVEAASLQGDEAEEETFGS